MWTRLVQSGYLFPFLMGGTLLSSLVGVLSSNPYLLPLFNILIAYPVMFTLLSVGKRKRAVFAMLFWALCMGVFIVTTCIVFPSQASAAILHGPEYKKEMFYWIQTGVGAEGNPSEFIPQHALHLGIFVVLSLISGGILSLLMGSVLMNYMGYYVASVIQASPDKWTASWMGWHPWSILRIVAFVILGIVLAEPLICWIRKRPYEKKGVTPYLWVALAGLILDVCIKASLAPWWGITLRNLLFSG